MTMPHLMNCPHQDDGWCLDCLGELFTDDAAARTTYRIVAWIQSKIDAMDIELVEAASTPLSTLPSLSPEKAKERIMRVMTIASRIDRCHAAKEILGRMPLSVINGQ